MRTIALWMVGLGSLMIAGACGSGKSSGGTGGEGGEGGDPSSGPGSPSSASATGAGGGGGVIGPNPGEFGAPCAKNGDCDSLLCSPIGDGKAVCSKKCAGAGDCPPGPEWSCAELPNAGTICQCQQSSSADSCDARDNNCDGYVDNGATCGDPMQACQNGQCSCGPDFLCDGECVDKTSDVNNCGKCGVVCTGGSLCSGGQCGCSKTQCGNNCVDTATDGANCGSCGHSCQGGECLSGACQPVAIVSGLGEPRGLAIDAQNVYFTDKMTGKVSKAPIAGGNPTALSSGETDCDLITINATQVFWVNGEGAEIRQVAKTGGGVMTLATGEVTVRGIAASVEYLLWTDYTNDAVRLAFIGMSGAYEWVTNVGGAWGITINAAKTDTYFTASTFGYLDTRPVEGNADVVATGLETPTVVAVDNTNAYIVEEGLGQITKVKIADGTAQAVASGQNMPYAIAVDTTKVYWLNTGGDVVTAPIAGGNTTVLATGQASPGAIAVDGTSVYWTNSGSGEIMKLAK